MLHRPTITGELITEINELITERPKLNRTQISKELCRRWNWATPSGTLKDMSCRDMLRLLDRDGKIKLPTSQTPSFLVNSQTGKHTVKHLEHDTTPVTGDIQSLLPLIVDLVNDKAQTAVFKSYIDQYHYLGFDRTVGENIKYMIKSQGGTPLACLLFGSAAWSCRDRDAYIDWNNEQRRNWLQYMTNNTRFLIFPWVHVSCLASHTLSLISRRISADWLLKYGRPILCLETFVESDRFLGTCYKAANWINVGKTTGRGRDDFYKLYSLPIKDVYLYPLVKNYRKLLCRDSNLADKKAEI